MTSDRLERLRNLSEHRDAARDQWRAAIVAAVRAGVPVADIATAAGVTRNRIYQIRDGKR